MGAGEGEVFADRYLGIGLADETFGSGSFVIGARRCRRQREGAGAKPAGTTVSRERRENVMETSISGITVSSSGVLSVCFGR